MIENLEDLNVRENIIPFLAEAAPVRGSTLSNNELCRC